MPSNAQCATPTKIIPCCPDCGSSDVCIDATAKWDVATQEWVLAGTQDTMTCGTCFDSFETADWGQA